MSARAGFIAVALGACVAVPGARPSSDTDPWFGDDPNDLDAERDNDEDVDPREDATGSGPFAELCGQPGTLFCDDFEDGLHPVWAADAGHPRLVSGAAREGVGTAVLELLTYDSVTSSKLLYRFEEETRVFARFDVQYADDYDAMGSSVLGPRFGGSPEWWGSFGRTGEKPRGDDFFVAFVSPIGRIGQGAEWALLAYFANMHADTTGTYFGNAFAPLTEPPPIVEPGRWSCVEFGLTLNAPGRTDGRADLSVDSVAQGPFEGLEWRTVPGLAANVFVLDSYNEFAQGSPPSSHPNRVRYDNVVISTEPVGCL
jgi:hypothetical protein